MAIVLAVRPVRRRVGPTLLVVVAMFGLGTIVFGVTRNYAVAFVALVVLSGADMIAMYIRGSLVPLVDARRQARPRDVGRERVHRRVQRARRVRERCRRRARSACRSPIAAGGVATVGVVGAYFVLFPSLRRIDTFEELDRPAETAVGSGG